MRAGSPRLLREINDRVAIEAMLAGGPLTRAELETLIGLSKPATAQLLARLESEGTVRRCGLRGGGRGPRAQLWRVNGALAHVAAVDLTPRTVDVAVADIAGAVLAEHRAPMPRGRGADVLSAFVAALDHAAAMASLTRADLRHVVVGSPGAVDPRTGRLGFAPHLPGWEGFDVPGRLRELLGGDHVDVVVENDVNLLAAEEMATGRAVDARDFVLLCLTPGVGSAVVINRTVLRGATGGAGEIDWMRVPDRADRDTGVDRRGARFGDLLGSAAVSRLAQAHGLPAGGGWAVLRRALATGPAGRPFLTDLARRVATGIAGVVSVVDPELVLLSVGVGEPGVRVLCDLVADELHRMVVPRTPVEPARAGAGAVRSGALRSALALARERVFGLPAVPPSVPR
ncbi:Sugar kinase of the NBD/HSP70 family, may containing an N-terminal HTH domain [Streptoalloteichus tenebrarius]|uniref:Sugar kinase of the NBD/HSP70 family, may containing an N-terminal HTH domain n=1 Tax=Streptoalloteichus tenebrarius (strain ATCC 17920 / DSM 40477 / JCM 4838 / CBS 697.72 / NBRC 16177 / NCIMB 11028 / NRRL B-12390 / A12253. 1 / ISP 5477) TaxID=1933 RepID=A0ABT1HYN3_STRSD|nr:ROK family protein [Streptoalloteichus tenebrarius]MCP2260629.1 Sugar kinase of the NBD/HSP70 family, may containing an N-terminal HTH domain [Streptoalloteichus tenebrarius]BFF01513.1 ROK family transcriptional regulator [Streptoalloteichus tenebrarius]